MKTARLPAQCFCAASPGQIRQAFRLQTPTAFQKRALQHTGCPNQQFLNSRRYRRGHLVVTAAVFGVGAPEALLVGVVALVVFGPKGLAQAVKSLGTTLKTFAPSLRELASVTNELSSTLQEQIGMDDIRNEFRNPAPTYRSASNLDPRQGDTSTSSEKNADGTVKDVEDKDLQAKIEESKRMAWAGSTSSTPSTSLDASNGKQETKSEGAQKAESKQTVPKASEFSIEELEAELKRRKESAKQ